MAEGVLYPKNGQVCAAIAEWVPKYQCCQKFKYWWGRRGWVDTVVRNEFKV